MIFVPTEKKLDWKSPPIVLCCLVFINVVIFLFYQTNDGEKLNAGVQSYSSQNLLALEWPAYRDYVFQERVEKLPATLPKEYEENFYSILLDQDFIVFLKENQAKYIPENKQKTWLTGRAEVDSILDSVSSIKYGLIPSKSNSITFITYQFLHGSVMHLIGNMVFLVLFGFAVEAALGHWRFLSYYLIGGVGSAAFHILIEGVSSTPLIGASGSISAVMAMYICLYQLKKIEFFYWFLIFVGYVRAPAILLLPVYIGYEVFKAYTIEGSNVAYAGHIGGFITGAILVFLTQILTKKAINEEYLNEEPDKVDPYIKGVDMIYKEIAHFRLKNAYKLNQKLIKKFGNRPETQEFHFNLLRGLSQNELKRYLLTTLGDEQISKKIIHAQWKLWRKLDTNKKQDISIDERVRFAIAALDIGLEDAAISIYHEIEEQMPKGNYPQISSLAHKISQFYYVANQTKKGKRYFKSSQQYAVSS